MKEQDFKETAAFFKLFSNENRLKIIDSLSKQSLSVSEIVEETGLSQSLVSQQLKIMKDARVLENEKRGKSVNYSIKDNHILHLCQDVFEHLSEK